MGNASLNLETRAEEAMRTEGFLIDFRDAVQQELTRPEPKNDNEDNARDLRSLLWSSVDNVATRDLDQVEWAEALPGDEIRVMVGIADVDRRVARGSALDLHAATNTLSVYTGVRTFPMLPERLSTDLTSLLEGQDRLALIVSLRINAQGEARTEEIFEARVRNQARLDYDSVSGWFEGQTRAPEAWKRLPELERQLRLQFEAGRRLWRFRKEHGALTFNECEPLPVVRHGELQELVASGTNCAREMIESLMIASNVAVADFLRRRGIPFLRRIVRVPKRWDRIRELAAERGAELPEAPEARALAQFLAGQRDADPQKFPHLSLAVLKLLGPGEYVVKTSETVADMDFGLAVNDYTHFTAPNRRYADLIVQRLVKAGVPTYPQPELEQLAVHCTERAHAARKVERLVRKIAAAALLQNRIGETFEGIVTGVKAKGTFVRLIDFPAEGKVMRGEAGLDVGQKVRVRLIETDLDRGFIDLEAIDRVWP